MSLFNCIDIKVFTLLCIMTESCLRGLIRGEIHHFFHPGTPLVKMLLTEQLLAGFLPLVLSLQPSRVF